MHRSDHACIGSDIRGDLIVEGDVIVGIFAGAEGDGLFGVSVHLTGDVVWD